MGGVSATIPENIRVLAELTHRSEVEVLNDLLAQWVPEGETDLKFLSDGQSAAMLRNDGEWVSKRNTYGKTLWDSSLAQFQLPKDFEVSFYTDEGLSIDEAFSKQYGIEFSEEGLPTDPNLFLTNGGVNHIDFATADKMFGLTNITRWKKEGSAQLYSENPYKVDKPTMIKRRQKKPNIGKLPTIFK